MPRQLPNEFAVVRSDESSKGCGERSPAESDPRLKRVASSRDSGDRRLRVVVRGENLLATVPRG